MQRIGAVCAALILFIGCGAGCSGRAAPDEGEIKQAFIRQLVGVCADVDSHLAHVSMDKEPGVVADQLGRFVKAARSQAAPDTDRAQFDVLLTEMDRTVSGFRDAQTALAAGDQPTYQAALAQAKRQLGTADAAAQKYGMPPLDSCPDHVPKVQAAGWQARKETSTAVQQMNAAVVNGRIWVAGGLTASTKATTSIQCYRPDDNTWEQGPALPKAVDHAMLVTYQGRAVLIGGFHSRGGESVASDQVLIFDDSIGHWMNGPPLRHARAAGAAAVVGDKIVVIGGRTGQPEKLVTQTEIYDGEKWSAGADIPIPGDHLAATADRDHLYAIGGREFKPAGNTNAVQRYDPDTRRWDKLADLPERISGAGAAIISGQLFVVSGEDATPAVVPTLLSYDLTAPTAAWTTLPPLAQGRHGLAVAAVGNTLYAIGGSTRPGHTASVGTVDALTVPPRPANPAAAWLSRTPISTGVQQMNASVVNGRVWVAGGLTASTTATTSVQSYNPDDNTWRSEPALPKAVDHAMLVTYHGGAVLIGGFHSRGGESVASDQVLFFDDSIGHWVNGPPLRHARAAGAAAVVGDKIVVIGGRTGQPEKLVRQTEIYDGKKWRDGAPIPVAGDHLAATADRDNLYAIGGREFKPAGNTNAVQRYNLKDDVWEKLTDLPERISGAGAAIISGKLFVVSGENATPSVVPTVLSLDLTAPTAAWTTLPPLAQGRHGLAVAAVGNTLYAIGGSTRPGHTASVSTVDALTFS